MIVALFVITFLESIAATLLQRGLYFYTHEHLGFSENQNLWIAFGFGATYIVGAFASHGLTRRLGERRVLLACLFGLLAIHTLLALFPAAWLLVVGVFASATVQGAKWPVVERSEHAALELPKGFQARGYEISVHGSCPKCASKTRA